MYQECRHIKVSGSKCGAAALQGKPYCYFHFRAHQQRHRAPDPFADHIAFVFDPPLLEDRSAIQLAISEVVRALGSKRIDPKRAGTLLYGLQLASANAKFEDDIVAEDQVRELCQNEEGEDIAPEATALEEGDEDGEEEPEEEEDDEEEDDDEDEDDDEEEEDTRDITEIVGKSARDAKTAIDVLKHLYSNICKQPD